MAKGRQHFQISTVLEIHVTDLEEPRERHTSRYRISCPFPRPIIDMTELKGATKPTLLGEHILSPKVRVCRPKEPSAPLWSKSSPEGYWHSSAGSPAGVAMQTDKAGHGPTRGESGLQSANLMIHSAIAKTN